MNGSATEPISGKDPDVAAFREACRQQLALHDTLTLQQQRKAFDTIHGMVPPAVGCVVEPIDLSGVPAEKITPQDAAAGKALVYFHGGGHINGSLTSHRHLATRYAAAAGVTTFNIDYRLAPEHPYPAGLADAVKAFQHVLTLGFEPRDILVGGESAGGNLAAALLLKLREFGVPQPAGLYLLSPWLDMLARGESYDRVGARDPMISRERIDALAALYLGGKADDIFTSPVRADLSGLPPMLIQIGSEEVLLSESLVFAHNAALAGIDVTLRVWPEMPHAWPLFHFAIRAGLAGIAEAGQWMQQRFK